MSEEILKRFYTKILRLLENNRQKVDDSQIAATLEAFRERANKDGLSQAPQGFSPSCRSSAEAQRALLELGLEDVHAFIEALQGHDNQALDAECVNAVDIFHSHLSRVLPILEQSVQGLEQHSLPPAARNLCQATFQHVALLQKMLEGVRRKSVFPTMQGLIAAYPGQTPELKKATVATLKQVGKPVVLALVDSLYHGRDDKQEDIPGLLKEMGYLAVPALIVALNYPDEKVRYAAAEILKKMKGRDALPALVDTLQDPSWRVRKAAAEALGEAGSSRAISGLIDAIKDKHASVRLEAVKSLGKLQDPKVLKPLLEVLEDASWEVRRAAVEAMAEFGSGASAFLARALQNDSLVVRKIASRRLAELGTREAVPALARATQDKDISVRERAIVALGRIKGEDALGDMVGAIEDKAPLVRFAAVQVLTNIGTRAALPLLNNALKDTEQIIRQRANSAIEAILKREKTGEIE